MKRIFAIILTIAALAIFCCSTVTAAENTEMHLGYHFHADHATVLGRDITSEEEISIPSSVDELPVYAIESSGFDGYEKITSLEIPEPVNTIGSAAFMDCINLRNIKIASSVKHIEKDAFLNCGYYNNVNNWDVSGTLYIDDILIRVSPICVGSFHVKEGTRLIADGAFEGCTDVTDVLIPDSVEYVGRNVFLNSGVYINSTNWTGAALYVSDWLVTVEDITEFSFKEDVYKIADGAFQNCDGLETVTIPEGVKRIGPFTFWDCSNLASVSIPASVEYIGENAFTHCNLSNISVHPDNMVYTVYDGVLYTKDLMTVVKCPENRNRTVALNDKTSFIGDSAFWGCEKLESIVLSPDLVGIGRSAFTECYALGELDLPESVKRIGQFAFSNCNSFSSIIIPDGVTILEENAFSCCLGLEKIKIGAGVKEIKAWTFEYCEKLNDIVLHSEIQKIGYLSFFETAFLKDSSNYDEQGLLMIDNYLIKARENSDGIYNVPYGTTLIATDCFEDCNIVNNIILPKSLKYINYGGLSVGEKIQRITYRGTESQWYAISIDSLIGTYPEDGIIMLSNIPTTKIILICTTSIIVLVLIYIAYKKQRDQTGG